MKMWVFKWLLHSPQTLSEVTDLLAEVLLVGVSAQSAQLEIYQAMSVSAEHWMQWLAPAGNEQFLKQFI